MTTVERPAMERQSGRCAVVVTRAEPADGPLCTHLRSFGLPVLLWPAVSIGPGDSKALAQALKQVETFDWIVFASRHAVTAVVEQLPAKPPDVRIAAVGPATAEALRLHGWDVDLTPKEANAASLVAAFAALPGDGVRGARVLFPASSRALPTLLEGLAKLGADVHQVEAYRTESSPLDVEECRAWIARDAIGAVTFASPSAVIELERALGAEDFDRLLSRAAAVAIGPTTARALADRGRKAIVAESATLHGLALTTFRLMQARH